MHTLWNRLQKNVQDQITPGTLYVVATPIGNLADITIRAMTVLGRADIICAEDTRVTAALLRAYSVTTPRLISVREHNERERIPTVLDGLAQGKIIALVSDAGSPAISDPGTRLVAAVRAAGFPVVPTPGPSAVIAALSASGIVDGSFLFYGFLPAKSGERSRILSQWEAVTYVVACYEAPHRLVATLKDIVHVLGPLRNITLARELTKTFETFKRLPAQALLRYVEADAHQQKGEMVLLIEPVPPQTPDPQEVPEDVRRWLSILLQELPTKQAAGLVAKITGNINRKQLYDWALKLKQK